jgi:hypothetical protein
MLTEVIAPMILVGCDDEIVIGVYAGHIRHSVQCASTFGS